MSGAGVDKGRKWTEEAETREEVRETQREFRSERVDALSWTTSRDAQEGLTQSSVCAEV